MKSDTYLILYKIISSLAILSCLVPLVILVKRQLWKERVYALITLYWLINTFINIQSLFGFSYSSDVESILTLSSNLLDVPLILSIFWLAAEGIYRKVVLSVLISFILMEIILNFSMGFNFESNTIIVGVGLSVAIIFSVAGVIRYLQKLEHSAVENTTVFVYASSLFGYGASVVIFVFNYLSKAGSVADSFFLYYSILLVTSLVTIYGLIRYARIPVPEYQNRISLSDVDIHEDGFNYPVELKNDYSSSSS